MRRLLGLIHLLASMGWIGALLVFLVHAVASVASRDEQVIRAAAWAMDAAAWLVILPLALATAATGLALALATAWGLVRHYWVVFKLALTLVATSVLLLKLGPIEALARLAQEPGAALADTLGLRISLLAHAAGGLLVLLAAAILGFYKPAGVVRGTPRPRWVTLSLAAGAVLLVALLLMVSGGGHGPAMHLRS